MPLWWVTSHKALQSVCKLISVFFPLPVFPSVDKWTSRSVVSSYLSGEGLPGLLDVKPERFCLCITLLRVILIVQVSDDIFTALFNDKKKQKHIGSLFGAVTFLRFAGNGRCRDGMLQMKAPGGMLCSSLRRRVKLDIRRCVAVAPPASADLIKAQTGAIWRKDLKIKSFSSVPFSPRSYCLPFRLHVSWVLNSPSLNSLISCCLRWGHPAAGLCANDTPQAGGLINKAETLQDPPEGPQHEVFDLHAASSLLSLVPGCVVCIISSSVQVDRSGHLLLLSLFPRLFCDWVRSRLMFCRRRLSPKAGKLNETRHQSEKLPNVPWGVRFQRR